MMFKTIATGITVVALISIGVCGDGHTQSPSLKAQEWKLSTLYTQNHPRYAILIKFKELIEKRTEGLIKIKIFPGSSLFPTKEEFMAVSTKAIEISFCPPQYSESKHPITGFCSPWGYWTEKKWLQYHDEVTEIMNKSPYGMGKYGVKLLFTPTLGDYYLITRMFIESPDQLKGKLIRSGGGMMGKCIEAIGGKPSHITAPETYMALQRGTMDGGWMDGQRVIADKLWEVAQYAISGPNWASLFVSLYMSFDVFNNLPATYQKVVMEVSRETLEFGVKLEREEAAAARGIIEPKMKRLLWMPEETMLRFRTKQEPVIEDFVKKYGSGAARIWEIMKAK